MEDRYEIRGKIGAGGLGTVYRGFDLKMKREVAIKRILTNPDDPTIQEEATKQLAAEAGALASLQHPHIVTVYDVGHDEDGPYVVMELINGRTLDEIIEVDPMTWDDFRELAMQTQEALIAAQELNMIHSDLKPPNLMLTWLPSGKFQIKIVDFGLAMLAQNQNAEELATIETVFGSIFFMPPEQFEREVLDARSDLYSMGCVYYQCLTGKYPFMGYDGEEVMNAHLEHTVTPIQDIRADVPLWVCDWVMWQINREREDRPQSARESLAVFIQNNRRAKPEMSTGRPPAAGPKLIIPGAGSPASPDAPEPIVGKPLEPPGDLASVATMAVFDEEEELEEEEAKPETAVVKINKAQPTAQPTGALLSPTQRFGTQPMTTGAEDASADGQAQVSPVAKPPKAPMSPAAKIVIGAALAILVLITGSMLISRSKQNAQNERIAAIMKQAAEAGTTEVPMNRDDLNLFLERASFTGSDDDRANYYAVLTLAKAPDGVNFDIAILNYATKEEILPKVRIDLIGKVLRDRANEEILPLLLEYGTTTTDMDAAVAAFRAAYSMGQTSHVSQYVEIIASTQNASIRREAVTNLAKIIDESAARDSISNKISAAYDKAGDPQAKNAFIRLLGNCSTDGALQQIRKVLEGDDGPAKVAATAALGEWKDDRAIPVLLGYLSGLAEAPARRKPMEAVLKVASQESVLKNPATAKTSWENIRKEAATSKDKEQFIRAVVLLEVPWNLGMVQPYVNDPDMTDLAKKGVKYINDQRALKNKQQGGD